MKPDLPTQFVRWNVRLPWLVALGVAVGGTVLTAIGSAVGQMMGLPSAAQVWVLAAFVLASALIGWGSMWVRHRPTDYGFTRPRRLREALWGIPLAIIPVVALVAGGIHVSGAMALAYAALTIAVGFNEEIWFRGLLPAAFGRSGEGAVLWGSALFFGVLHLVNALRAESAVYLALQVVYAFVVAVALLLVVRCTGSLWIPIVWHAAYDFCSYLGGDRLTTATVVALGLTCLVLIGYSVWLWPRRARRS